MEENKKTDALDNDVDKVDTVTAEAPKKDDDDDFSWGGCIATFIVIAVIAWALIHFNPSEEKHIEKIADVTTAAYLDGYELSGSGLLALSDIKYHSLGIVSWTTIKYHGKSRVTSIGAVGFVYPLIEY